MVVLEVEFIFMKFLGKPKFPNFFLPSCDSLVPRLIPDTIMASEGEAQIGLEENFEWNVDNEIRLFEAMIGHKPVGINKHFHMACISERFENLMGKPVASDVIWKHLESMYDLAALDKKESIPFPNEQEDFSLPESDYLDLINEKVASKTESASEAKDTIKEGRITPKNVKDPPPTKEPVTKKEKKSDVEDNAASNETEKKENTESENEGKKGKINKEEKVVKTRGKRSMKDKKTEEDTHQVSGSKKEEENSSSHSSSKKDKHNVGKRTLRSRADDLSTKSLTPPPTKRARRT